VRRTTALVLSSLLAGVGLVTVAPAAQATTDTAVQLPLTAFRDLVVDDAHSHVFVTGGGSDGVVVRDLEGGAVTTITNEPGASQMALSEDGTLLYVALASGDAVSAIDTTTLTETTRYPTGASTCPSAVAVTGGKIWFGYGCSGSGSLGVIDPAAVDPAPVVRTGLLGMSGIPGLQSSPALPTVLVTGPIGLSPSTIQLVDVSSGTPSPGASVSPGENLGDWAISPDGSHVVAASGYPYQHPSYKTTDLSADGVYGSNHPYPNSVALATGLVAAGVNGIYDPDIYVYRTDGSLVRSYEIGGYGHGDGGLNAAGLAFSADATRLYAVTGGNAYGGAVRLHVLHDPGKAPSTIALTPPSTASINHAFGVTGSLSSGIPVPAGALITVQRDSAYGTVNLPSRTTGAGGAFTIPDTVSKRGTYGYRATWAGDATHAGTTTRVLVKVLGLATTVSITTSAGPYSYGAKPVVVAHLGTTKVRTLSIYAQPYGGTKTRIKVGTVDAHGNLSVAYTITRRTTFTATFAGDDTYEPKSVAKALLSRAKVASALYGYYGTSGSYRLFHTSVDPTLLVAVSPNNAGTCVSYLAQLYYSGAWHNSASLACDYLDSTSHSGAVYYSSAPAGVVFRMRATFKGNSRNVATVGGWVYGKFTR
jgi:YVTN family beta-propeller protein